MLNSWLCPGSLDGHHVFTWAGSSTNPTYRPSGYCQCGQAYYDAQEKRITLMFPGYNPFGPHAPQPTPAPDVPLAQFKAAQQAGASHLSADGKYVFTVRYGETLVAKWDEWERSFGPWSPCDGLPADAVVLK